MWKQGYQAARHTLQGAFPLEQCRDAGTSQ